MSVVTTIIVTASCSDDDIPLEKLDLPSIGGSTVGGRLKRNDLVMAAWGGWKHPQASIWAGGFNNLDDQAAVDLILAQPWEYPRDVQVFLMAEQDDRFGVYDLANSVVRG